MLGSLPGGLLRVDAQSNPKQPHPEPPSGIESRSWFLLSRPVEPGFITDADRFEVYDGRTFEVLGGFPAVDTWSVGVTADPARILLDTLTGPSIFDLDTGTATRVTWDTGQTVSTVRLPDPRWAPPTPPRWSFFSDIYDARALLVDLDNATGVDLAETLVAPGETAGYPTIRFAPDGGLAVASVAYNGFYLLDPESPADARLLDGGRTGMISWSPEFSPDSSRLVYVLREPSGGTVEDRLVVEEVGSDDVTEIGSLGPDGFAVFPLESNDDLIILDGGMVTRREIEGGREIWQAESEEVALALGITGNTLVLGSARQANGTPTWQTIDLDTGESLPLRELRGLTYYNGSYVNPEPAFQLMGPSYDGAENITGRLAAIELTTGTITTLLDATSGQSLSLAYGTSEDGGTVFYAPRFDPEGRYHLFNLPRGEQRAFPVESSISIHDPSVSPDGATAGFTHWDNSGSGRMEAWLLDVAGGGEPEPFMEGRLWLWAGGTPASRTSARPIARAI